MVDSLREREQHTPPGQTERIAEIQRQHIMIQQQQQIHHHQQQQRQHAQQIQHHTLQQQARLAEQHRQIMMVEREREQRERDREREREREAVRASVPRHTPSPQMPVVSQAAQVSQAPSPAQRESVNRATPVSQPGLSGGCASSGASAGSGRPSSTSGDSTLTAASVIDAIITHTINEGVPSSNTSHPGPLTSRLGDRLFQSFHREQTCPQTNDTSSKASPLKNAPATSEAGPDSGSGINSGPPPPSGPPKKTLGDHIDSMISKDLNVTSNPVNYPRTLAYPYHIVPPTSVAPGAQSVEELSNWKLRRAIQQEKEMEAAAREREKIQGAPQPQADERQIIRIAQMSSPRKGHVEPVSPPDSASSTPVTTSSAPSHHWLPTSGTPSTVSSAGSVPPSVAASVAADPMGFLQQRRFYPDKTQLSPLDYVKNRIVEVMRTSEDDKVESRKEDGEAGSKSEGRSGSPSDMVIDESRPAEKESSAVPPHTQPPYVQTTTTYAYPFSALSVPQAAVTPQAVATAPKPPGLLPPSLPKEREPVAEPKPLLSSQYEALSDED